MTSGLFQTEAVAQSLANLACLEEVQQEGPALGHGGLDVLRLRKQKKCRFPERRAVRLCLSE